MRIRILEYTGQSVLAGAGAGRTALGKLITTVAEEADDSIVYLDFKDVDVATASFLRETVLGFRTYSAQTGRAVLVVNVADAVVEELEHLLRATRDAMVVATIGVDAQASDARVIGHLDEKQALTLMAVLDLGEADAATLVDHHEDETIGITGWNNRLSGLAAKGILAERRVGRTKRYRAVVDNLRYGH